MNCSRELTISFELGLGLGIEIFVIGSDSSVNYPIRSEFELGEDIGLSVLEVATRRTSVRDWIDMCHDLGGSESDHYKSRRRYCSAPFIFQMVLISISTCIVMLIQYNFPE